MCLATSPEQRVRKDHPLRPIRTMVDKVLKDLAEFDKISSKVGRRSIPPEQMLRLCCCRCCTRCAASGCWWRRSTTTYCFAGPWGSTWTMRCGMPRCLPRTATVAGGRSGKGVSVAGGGASPRAGLGLGRALHGRWRFAGSLGQRE